MIRERIIPLRRGTWFFGTTGSRAFPSHKRPRDFGSAVGGSVVDDDQFKRDSRLRDKRFETKREASFFIPRGNDDGDDRNASVTQ
jgi:hypothetical protein